MNIGFIGFGEAAYEFAKGFKDEGVQDMVAFDPQSEHDVYGSLIHERAFEAHVELKTSSKDVIQSSNIIFVAVPADKALEVGKELKAFLEPDDLYIDISASSPKIKKEIWSHVEEKGAHFVDAAVMGPVVVYKHQVPILASGNGADTFIDLLSKYGMKIKKVNNTPGSASSVKLIRSIYMKGVSALMVEMLEAAEEYEVSDIVIESLSETIDSKNFFDTMNRLVTGTSIHAARRSKELEGSIHMLEDSNIEPEMSKAARNKLISIGHINLKEKFEGQAPKLWQDVIKHLKTK